MTAVHPAAVVDLENYLDDCRACLAAWLRAEAEGPDAKPDDRYEEFRAAIRGLGKRVVMEHNARTDPGEGF